MLFSLLMIPFNGLFAQHYELVYTLPDNDAAISYMATHPSKKMVIVGDQTGKLYFRDSKTGQLNRKIQAHTSPVHLLSFNSNGKLMITASNDGEIKIFDFETDAIIQSIFSPDYKGINFALFSIADGFLYFNSGNRIYKTRSDLTQKVNLLFQEQDTISGGVISSDRGSIIYSCNNQLKVMDTRTDEIRQEFNSGPSPINQVRFINDTLLTTWSNDGTINFWIFKTGQIIASPALWMKAGTPGAMAFDASGTKMVTGNVGNWARVWNPFEKSVEQELFGHKAPVTATAFGDGLSTIFTGSKDATIRLWKDKTIKTIEPTEEVSTSVKQDTSGFLSDSSLAIAIHQQLSDTTSHPKSMNSPEVKMEDGNKPGMINGRSVRQEGTITVNTPEITIYVFDNSTIDGDTMSLYFNNNWILDHYGVTKSKKPITLNLIENTNNFLVLFANNLGKTPPNTAAIQFFDGKSDRFFRLSSDLSTCSALNFIYNKP